MPIIRWCGAGRIIKLNKNELDIYMYKYTLCILRPSGRLYHVPDPELLRQFATKVINLYVYVKSI